jgi:hypothetical protein
MLTPLYGFVAGDTLGLLVLARHDDKIADVIKKMKCSASVRLRWDGEGRLIHDGHVLSPDLTVQDAGLEALDRVDLVRDS